MRPQFNAVYIWKVSQSVGGSGTVVVECTETQSRISAFPSHALCMAGFRGYVALARTSDEIVTVTAIEEDISVRIKIAFGNDG